MKILMTKKAKREILNLLLFPYRFLRYLFSTPPGEVILMYVVGIGGWFAIVLPLVSLGLYLADAPYSTFTDIGHATWIIVQLTLLIFALKWAKKAFYIQRNKKEKNDENKH